MNLLAHAYLSFNDPDILAGNMISDFVKGKKQYDYPAMIQKGIKLHRLIDNFTDEHSATRQIMQFFRPAYRLYSGAFTDIVYDYFLANDRTEFASSEELERFSISTYTLLEQNMLLLPQEFRAMFPYMRKQNWLYNYRNEEGIMKSFNGMAHRARYIKESATAYSVFLNNMEEMRVSYQVFFPLLKNYAMATLKELLNND